MMKKILAIISIFILTTNVSFGSPLILKVKKEVTALGLVELASFDATKYKQIRIGVKISGIEKSATKGAAEIELNLAKQDFERKTRLLESGDITKYDYDIAKEKLRQAQMLYDNTQSNNNSTISIYGIENDDEILLVSFEQGNGSRSVVIDTPPTKISVKVSKKGSYSLYVWGQ